MTPEPSSEEEADSADDLGLCQEGHARGVLALLSCPNPTRRASAAFE